YHPSSSSKPIFNLVFLNKILYWLSAFNSEERLLYKYSYASPGALYATQIYLEINKIQGLSDGYYYFNQIEKTLHKVADCEPKSQTFLNFHFIGDQSAIKNVYQNNVKEVLEIETGHLVGSIDALVNKSQYALKPIPLFENLIKKFDLNENHYYIRSFKLVDLDDKWIPNIELLIQENNSASMPSKITWIRKKQIKKFKCDLKIEKNDVIAINQSTYERSMLGISIISRETDPVLAYIALGIGLDVIQRNDLKLGFMSSGYSSKSDNNLPSTFKLYEILKKIGVDPAPTYFCVGGKISQSQIEHEGMNEDSVHIDGPAEIIKNEISKFLPKYMIPNQIIVVKKLPLNPSGKVSYKDLYTLDEYSEISLNKPYKMPSTETEIHLSNLWSKLLNIENVSALDDFFQIGGNSLNVIKMITHIYNDFQIKIKAQDIFQYSSLNILAKFIDEKRDNKEDISSSRVIYMNSSPKDLTNTVICWPGLGGYPLKMKNLAKYSDKKFIAIQSYGLNADEKPYKTINDMALADIMELEKLEIDTPLSLWGYSFGAKIAFEVATILEKKNKKINELVLICPGNPLLDDFEDELLEFNFKNKRFVAVLLSVFFGKIDINMTLDCIDKVNNINEFNDYVYEKLDGLELSVIERITNLILKTYQFDYKFENISKGDIGFPIKIIKAKGDDYTFINTLHNAYRDNISMIDFDSDHYNILNQNNAKKLVNLI
ncbi:hypothetical protein DCO44_06950, partial [Acinetobacter sp. AM]|uniref:thioesterase domain-containing protein n=1 Tax=Acinetobacter sp. AM TaxID=2170730 RepID=UPI000DE63A96